jgi:putative nucleotidyltransferase with HDIG domain
MASGTRRRGSRSQGPRSDAMVAEERWQRRRAAALALRTTMIVAPLAASVSAMALLSRVLPTPASGSAVVVRLAWWSAILAASLASMWLVDRLTKRLAPLAALCDMAVLFPGRAPTRLAVARRAGDVRLLKTKVKSPDVSGLLDDAVVSAPSSTPADAAEQILSLVGALRAHDRHTRGHSERVRVYTDLIADEMRLPTAAVDRLRWAALLHDIGKLAIPATTLNKPAKLSNAEWDAMRRHPAEGARLARALLPWLGEWGLAIAEHHERWDGTGYPTGISGRDISVAGRIVAVADAFEVMTAPRAYKRAMTRQASLEELVRASGTQFDPDVVRAFLRVSAPKLRWAMGPTSWLVGTPFLGAAPSLTGAGVAAQAAVSVTSVAVAGVTGLAAPVAMPSGAPTPTSASSSPSATAAPTPHPTNAAVRGRSPRPPAPHTAPSPTAPTSLTPTLATSPKPRTSASAKPSQPGKPTASNQGKTPPAKSPPPPKSGPPAKTAAPTATKTAPGQGKNSVKTGSLGESGHDTSHK